MKSVNKIYSDLWEKVNEKYITNLNDVFISNSKDKKILLLVDTVKNTDIFKEINIQDIRTKIDDISEKTLISEGLDYQSNDIEEKIGERYENYFVRCHLYYRLYMRKLNEFLFIAAFLSNLYRYLSLLHVIVTVYIRQFEIMKCQNEIDEQEISRSLKDVKNMLNGQANLMKVLGMAPTPNDKPQKEEKAQAGGAGQTKELVNNETVVQVTEDIVDETKAKIKYELHRYLLNRYISAYSNPIISNMEDMEGSLNNNNNKYLSEEIPEQPLSEMKLPLMGGGGFLEDIANKVKEIFPIAHKNELMISKNGIKNELKTLITNRINLLNNQPKLE